MENGSRNNVQSGITINAYNFMFYLAYIFLFTKEILFERTRLSGRLGTNVVNSASTLFHLLFWGCCICILLFLQSYKIREILLIAVLIMIFGLSAVFTRSFLLVDALLLILCSKKIDFDQYIKNVLYIQSILVIGIILLTLTGVIEMGTAIRANNEGYRNAWGFNHPNTLSILCFQWICQYIYIKRNDRRLKKYVIMLLITFSAYIATNSNTGFIMSVFIVIGNSIYEKIVDKVFSFKQIKKIAKRLFVLACIGIIIIIRYYWVNPDKLSATTLVSRINLSKNYLIAYGVNLFGHNIVQGTYVSIPGFPKGYYFLDNAYAWLLVHFGILAFLCILIAYIVFIRKLFKSGEWNLILIVFAYLVYGITEHTPLIFSFNSLLIGFYTVIYNKSINKIESQKEQEEMINEHS